MVFIKYPKQGIVLLLGFSKVMHYPSMFQVREPNVFLGYLKGIVGLLCSFEDVFQQCRPWCLTVEYLMKVLVSLQVLVGLCNTFPCVKIYVMEPNVFVGYLQRALACSLNFCGHEQYPFNSLDQNNPTHGVYSVTH